MSDQTPPEPVPPVTPETGAQPVPPSPWPASPAATPPFEVLDSGGGPVANDAAVAGHPSQTLLPSASPPPRRRGRVVALVAGGLAAVLLAAGGVFAYQSLSGGGVQPETMVPAGALAYADVDLDPAASQKVNAVRFFRHFPAADKTLGTGDDLRALVAKAFAGSGVDYARDVEPWLGQRFAVAIVGSSRADATGEIVLQVTDEAKAADSLPALIPAGDTFAVSNGYAVIASSLQGGSGGTTADQLVSQAQDKSLADDSQFTQALAPYGDGVASFYVDLTAVSALLPAGLSAQSPLLASDGIVAGVVKVEPDAVQLDASMPSTAATPAGDASALVAGLPTSTVVAVGFDGLADTYRGQWDTIVTRLSQSAGRSPDQLVAGVEQATGLQLPEDLFALLGSADVVAVDGSGLPFSPDFGLRAVSDSPRALPAARTVSGLLKQSIPAAVAIPTPDGYVLASSPRYAALLASDQGGLGQSSRFRGAVPGAAGSAALVYVDLTELTKLSGEPDPNLAPLQAVGFTERADGGRLTMTMRLTVSGS
jgi:hypothetical protein